MEGIMAKKYSDFLREITSEDLFRGLLGYGLFAEKLPPCFTSVPLFYFYKEPFANENNNVNGNNKKWHDFIIFDSQRNMIIPRRFGIPTPYAYFALCRALADNWDNIKHRLSHSVSNQDYIISRIHLRKMKEDGPLFSMNYKNWKSDGEPMPDLIQGKKYVVKTDISTCFPSIYTHAIPWALIGKSEAKSGIGNGNWTNIIDKACQRCTNGQTHGILIGPHASNLISEIILTRVDQSMYDAGGRYVRAIDDFTCYVDCYDDAQGFIEQLREELSNYDLSLNERKTIIEELPFAINHDWTQKLRNIQEIYCNKDLLSYHDVAGYLSAAISLMEDNQKNAAPLTYALKVLSGKEMKETAKDYYVKMLLHLAYVYPYLVHHLEEYVFDKFNVPISKIKEFSNLNYKDGVMHKNVEKIYFALYFAWRYGFSLPDVNFDDIVSSNSCICKILGLMYAERTDNLDGKDALKQNAEKLAEDPSDFDRNWLFIYEVLPKRKLKDEWKVYKEAGISFIKQD